MGEWLKPAVLKTVSGVTRSGVRIPLPPPATPRNARRAIVKIIREQKELERYQWSAQARG
jgi:hypothetical protein